MAELKALSQDVLKNSSDIENYNTGSRIFKFSSIKSAKKPSTESVSLPLRHPMARQTQFLAEVTE